MITIAENLNARIGLGLQPRRREISIITAPDSGKSCFYEYNPQNKIKFSNEDEFIGSKVLKKFAELTDD